MTNERQVTLSDFTPGIYSNGGFTSLVPPAPLGAAQEANTYRCIGLPGGGLAPLPRRTNEYDLPFPGVGTTTTLVGMQAIPASSSASSLTADIVYVMMDADTNPRRNYLYALNTNTGAFTQVPWGTTAYPPAPGASTTFITLTTTTGPPVGCTSTLGAAYNPNTTGYSTIVGWTCPQAAAIGGSWPIFWFHGLDITTFRNYFIGSGSTFVSASVLFWHQMRLVYFQRTSYTKITGIGSLGGGPLIYTLPYLATAPFTAPAASATLANLYVDRLQSFGSYGSISTGELILIGQLAGESLFVQGDLDSPSVNILRGVHPTGKWNSPGLSTRRGLLYGTEKDGIWLWDGSNSSQKVSPQLVDNFYERTTPTSFNSSSGVVGESMHPAVWGDYVVYPNNFLLDMETMGWWKLDNPSQYNMMMFSSEGTRYLYGAIDAIQSGTTDSLMQYDKTVGANSYSWQSQPIPVGTPGRLVEVYDIEVKASVSQSTTNHTVTITLTNEDATTQAETFTFTSTDLNIPKRLRKPTFMRGVDIICRIEATGAGVTDAPVVHSVTLSVRDGSTTAAT